MTTLVFFADISWEGLHQRPHHLASRFSEEYTVLWVEPVVLSKRPSFVPVKVRKNLYVLSLPVFPYNARKRWLRLLAAAASVVPPIRSAISRYQARILRRALSHCSGNADNALFFFENIYSVHAMDRFAPRGVFYDYIDNFFGFVPLPHHVRRDWEYIVRRADAIFVTSPTLRRQLEKIRSDNIHLVGNGVEYDFFSRTSAAPGPPDMPSDKPVIGYVGAVYPWIDFDLLARICDEMPSVNVVVIGRAHPEIAERLERLEQRRNFSFLGFREYASIPSYVHRFSVGIVPFLRTDLTEGVNPVKLYEYWAAGVPVVATDFSPDLGAFVPHILIGKNHEEFIAALQEAMRRGTDENFRKNVARFASANDWNGKALEILRTIRPEIVRE